MHDVGIIGGGIIGTSAAAFLAEAGLRVVLFERAAIGAGASGRNSGAIQHPFDVHLARLHADTLALYRELAAGPDFALADDPAGLLLLSDDPDAVRTAADEIARHAPDLRPEVLAAAEVAALEPALAPGLMACRLETGYPVAPGAATDAFAARALRAGAELRLGGGDASVVIDGRRVGGVRDGSAGVVPCSMVLVAAGPWTPQLVPGWQARPPIRPVWGVVAGVALPDAPRHVLEELGIDRPGRPPDELFSLVTANGATSAGSTFLAEQPDPATRAARVLERAARFVPALGAPSLLGVRACARPVSFDGRPLIGPVDGFDGLYVCAGHGPWGISTGPASARLVADQMLRRRPGPDVFSPSRATAMP